MSRVLVVISGKCSVAMYILIEEEFDGCKCVLSGDAVILVSLRG